MLIFIFFVVGGGENLKIKNCLMNRYISLKFVYFKIVFVYVCREDMLLLVDFYYGIIYFFCWERESFWK